MNEKNISKGDYVLVNGEATEVFRVQDENNHSIILSTGCAEPIEKCKRIPIKFHKHITRTIKLHLDFEYIDQIK